MDQMLVQLLDAVFGADADEPKRDFAETQFMTLLESTTEDLAKALLAASGSPTPLTFERLRDGGRARDRPRGRRRGDAAYTPSMSTIRIAVASTPLTATLEEAVPAAIVAVEEAGRLGARIVCLPETGLPGHRDQPRPVPDVSAGALEEALREVAAAARRAGVVTIVGAERPTPAGREIVSVVFDADGTRLGEQAKTQIDPTEEAHYVAGSGRRVFTAAGLTFGIAICHEAFRYPEISRALVLAGAQVDLRPALRDHRRRLAAVPLVRCDEPVQREGDHAAGRSRTRSSSPPRTWPGPDQGSVTGVIAPDGTLVASLPYGVVGVVAADVDLDLATRRLALRWAPERSLPT